MTDASGLAGRALRFHRVMSTESESGMTPNPNQVWKLNLFAVLSALIVWSPHLRAETIPPESPDAGTNGEIAEESEESDETQPPPPSVPPATGLVPPSLETYAEAEYPPDAFAAGLAAEVQAVLDIDETGAVVGVRIIAPVGHGFDEAAEAAMRRFVFKPATEDGTPIPSRVTYRYRFFITEEAPPPETPPPPPAVAELLGRVRTMEDAPIAGAEVRLFASDEPAASANGALKARATLTDDQGQFAFPSLLPGAYTIEIVGPGFVPLTGAEAFVPGESREVLYRLALETSEYEVVVRAKRPSREVTRRVITRREITKIPGTGGDALRSVQYLPGVARASAMGGEIIVRGSSPGDSVFFLDSLNMPQLYHFGGLTSVINSDLLESIDFYPGNYSAQFGRATGGAIDVRTRAPKTDRFHAYIDADVWDVGALAEGPIGKHWSVAAAARRSYVDSFMKAANLMGDDITLTVAPRYYDYQLVADYHPSKENNLRIFFYGTDDKWIMDWDDASDPFWGNGLDLHLVTVQGQAAWRYKLSDKLANQLNVGFGYWGGNYDDGNMAQDWNVYPLLIREELTFDPGKYFIWRIGTDTELRWAKVKMKVPRDYGIEGEAGYNLSANDTMLTFMGRRFLGAPGLYTELELTALPKTQVIYGVRTDYYSGIDRWGVDPRVVVRYELFPTTTLKAGLGLFQQPPDLAEGDKAYGNPNLELTEAIHYSAGVEQRLFENIEIGVEGFYKDLRKVLRSSAEIVERDGEMVPERFNNDGKGRAYGMELQVKHHPTERFFGWVTYTLMRSERVDAPGEPTRLFDYDQTHILTVMGNVTVGWGIDMGLTFRLVSGNPYTPTVGGSYDADSDAYVPIYGKPNSRRMPLYHALDLRIDKKWQWRYLGVTLYLDVRNVYNRKNTEDYIYSFDYKQKAAMPGLPVLPSLGLKLEY